MSKTEPKMSEEEAEIFIAGKAIAVATEAQLVGHNQAVKEFKKLIQASGIVARVKLINKNKYEEFLAEEITKMYRSGKTLKEIGNITGFSSEKCRNLIPSGLLTKSNRSHRKKLYSSGVQKS